jgi:uncharacterized membrane protein YgcG
VVDVKFTFVRCSTLALLTVASASISAIADAHIRLDAPPARFAFSNTGQKTGPCGAGTATGTVTEVQAGSTLTVQWTETINHPGHYRISLDPDGGDDGLVNPASETDFYTNDNVLLDQIADKAGGAYSANITIPDTNCDKCTLQLIQVMTDKLPWGPQNGDDLYYWCADIRIVGGSDPTSTAASTSASSTSASSTSASSSSSGSGAGGAGEGGASGSGGEGGSPSLDADDGGCAVAQPGGEGDRGLVLGLALAGALALARRRAR